MIKQIRTTSELWLVEVDIIVTADVLMSDVRSGEMCGGVPGPGPGSRGSSASSTPCASRRSLNFEKINPGLLRSVPHTWGDTCTDTCTRVTLTHTHNSQKIIPNHLVYMKPTSLECKNTFIIICVICYIHLPNFNPTARVPCPI